MPEEPRDSQMHATMSSLKATHAAHRVANAIHATPTPELKPILEQHDLSQRESPYETPIRFVPSKPTKSVVRRAKIARFFQLLREFLVIFFWIVLLAVFAFRLSRRFIH